MEPTQELSDELFRERVLRARAMTPEQRFFEGFRLFDLECQAMRDGIRTERPGASAAEVEAILRLRIELMRMRERLEYPALNGLIP